MSIDYYNKEYLSEESKYQIRLKKLSTDLENFS